MKKTVFLSLLVVVGLFISCSTEDPIKDDQEPQIKLSPITITSLTSDFLYAGETLEIGGTNFANKDFPTKIFINDIEVAPKQLLNTFIQIILPENQKTGNNTLKIQINQVSSQIINFYTLSKGWNKLEIFGDRDVINSSLFDDSKTFFSFVDDNPAANTFNGQCKKILPSNSGYKETLISNAGSYGAFKMFNEKIGVRTNSIAAFYTNNGFENQNDIVIERAFSPEINGLRIANLDANSSIVYTLIGSQIYTANNGQTVIKNNPPTWATRTNLNSTNVRYSATSFSKSVSDNKYYQLGLIYDTKTYGTNVVKNVVMESETGYSDWAVKDTISNREINISSNFKFFDINKIYSINVIDKKLVESNDQLKTWKVIKNNAEAIFLRSTTTWYIQSENKLFVTADAGVTWNLELELPLGAVINDISFSKNKIIISGKKGLLYLKLE
ncbi:hypothetical protein HNP99_000697 [Flavobacterium sp. 28A]|uniref:hypothetical protein n=1 Tax=Flavobacterium sp. 28A TaxID=2735895 RepID=UPI00156E28B5|nr:hypothetical protein [Flavobacterium sp. 28A]NRT14357.1 hypothetical protein [Flavobacterium sp. 28A]